MSFDQKTINLVWEKAEIVSGNDKNVFRKDMCGAWIQKEQYGKRDHKYGWEIDHITTKANGGDDNLSNLRPLHGINNASRGNGKLDTKKPTVTSVNTTNHKLNDKGEYEELK
ncbi:HNH endonuclease [Dickeya oryzae]|uniref:HNH endonuclease signature motif containing protein n=1 Tax=Dickeya oryzae TaxID=1240404 RepID=UPI001AECE094|nr:HNH endonuclease signature motif containing protein [Dickeya oryzae]MBP2847364.1 HNH endonuclease [Dickeya oryzae]